MATRRCALLAMRIRCLSSLVLNDISTQQAVQSVCSLTGQELLRHTEESIRNGCLEEALKSAELLQQQGIPISRDLAHGLFRECSKGKNLDNVRRLQALIVNSGLDSVAIFNDHLIRLFTAHRSLGEAYQAFCNVAKPSKYTWNSIIGAHAKLGEGEKALQLYERMLFSGVESDKYTFTAVLQACGATSNLDQGRHFHDQVVERGFLSDVILGSALVDMYCKCGKLSEARKLFDELPNRNMVTWGAMIAGYAQQGEGVLALECFKTMQLKGIKPNNVIYFSILKACGSIGDIEQGRITHKQIVEAGLHLDIFVGNNLVDMYIKCGSLKEAQQVFDSLPSKDVVSWGTLIGGYAKSGNIEEAYKLLKKAPKRDVVSWGAVISGYAQCGMWQHQGN